MEHQWQKWSYLYVVIAAVHDIGANGLVTVAYVNGIQSMTFKGAAGYEGTYALSQEHMDFLDMLGEAGWEMVSHDVLSTLVVLQTVSYPEMKHFMVFKRRWTIEEGQGNEDLTTLLLDENMG